MINGLTAVVPFWILLSAIFGFLAGETCGNHLGYRKSRRELKRVRGELNHIREHLETVTKGLEKPAA